MLVSCLKRFPVLAVNDEYEINGSGVNLRDYVIRSLYFFLDVGFDEDASQACRGYTAENLAVIRHIGLNLLSRDKKARSVSKPYDSRLDGITTILRLSLRL